MGRGLRHHQGEGGVLHREVRPRVHAGHRRHGARWRRGEPDAGAPHPEDAERLLHPVGLRLLPSALHRVELHSGVRLSRDRLRGRPSGHLRQPRISGSGDRGSVGQVHAGEQPRRHVRPRHHRPHEARDAPHCHRPARELDKHACRHALAPAPRHRRGHGHGVAQRHHERGAVRPRLRGQVVLRLRRAEGACGHHAARARRRDMRGCRRRHPRRGPHVRQRQAGRHRLGPRVRPEPQRRAGGAHRHVAHGHHRQLRRPRRPAVRRHAGYGGAPVRGN